MAQTADRNLLFGVLALQMDFIKREQLIAAMQAWVFDKSKTLGQILREQKALAEDNHALLEALVQKHLAVHDNDVEKSLAAVSSVASVKKELEQIDDHDLMASLMHVPAAPVLRPADMYATMPPVKGSEADPGMRFRILRPHAKGGLGEVFVAHDQELHREVALKEIQERQADNTDSRNRFLVEAEITGGLEHPGIVPVYGLGTYADGRPYYAMRFIRGDSLKDAIDRFHKIESVMTVGQRALELRELLGRFVDVCNAIAYAHSRGVLHRDLKPGNIMLGKYGETLVVDWGLAKPMGQALEPTLSKEKTEIGEGSLIPHSISGSSHTLVGSAIGTPQYMSPEQAAGRHDQLGAASDVYSLGATMYCLLTGQAPFSDKDVGTVLQKVQRGEFPKPREIKANVPPALEAVCKKAMALLPRDRYASPRDLASDIENWLADEPVTAWPEPWTVKARRWANRHAVLVTGVASAVAIALISLTVATVLLTAANERERQAKIKADENFQMARAAVKRYLTEVSNNDLLREPGMEPLRKKLLEGAKEFNEKFVAERRGDPTVQAELAMATFHLGQITGDLDNELDAIKLHNEAVKLFEALPADKVTNETQADLAACYHHLGRLYRVTDQIKKSEDSYQHALKIWDKLAADHAKESRYRDGLARSQLGIGNLYQYTRQLDSAQKSYRNAIENWTKLHEAEPKAASYRRDLAIAHNNLGMVFNARDAITTNEAVKELREAQKIQKALAEEAPNVGQYQYDLGKTNYNLGERKDAARLWQALVEKHPSLSEAHRLVSEAHMALVQIYVQDQDLKKATEAAEKAISIQRKLIDSHPGVPIYRGDLGRGLVALGGVYHADGLRNAGEKSADVSLASARKFYEEAVAIQEKLTKDRVDVPLYQRDLARTYSTLASVYSMNKENTRADDAFKKSIGIWETLIKDHGADREYTDGLNQTCANLGYFCVKTTNYKDAVTWYTRALEGTAEKNRPSIRLARGGALLLDGKYAEAAADLEEAARVEKDSFKLYLCGKVMSQCAAAAAADNQKTKSDEYAARSISYLEASFAKADVNSPGRKKNLQELTTDAAFNTLQDRPQFKKLLSELKVN